MSLFIWANPESLPMSDDIRDYFNNRISQEMERNAAVGISTKYDELQQASRDKIASLAELHKLRLKQQQIDDASWGAAVGFNPGLARSILNVGQAGWEGGKSMVRSVDAAINTAAGNLGNVDEIAAAQKLASENGTIAKQLLMEDIDYRKSQDQDPGLVSAVKNVSGAMADTPEGTAQFIAEQLPNSALSLGAGLAGAKVGAAGGALLGPVGAAVGGTVGFLGGMFMGNSLLETGSKAIEKAQRGGMTEAKRIQALEEGAIKGGVITAVDAATLGLGGKLAKTFNKAAIEAGARAEARVLSKAGVDIADVTAVEKALSDPILRSAAKVAGQTAAKQTSTFGSKAVTAATGLTMETIGEGLGEHLGELAATGKADIYESVMEAAAGFTQSVPETAMAMNKAKSNDLDTKGIKEADLSIPDPVKPEKRVLSKKQETKDTVFKEAVQTGDVTKLVDPEGEHYNPERAIQALFSNTKQKDAKPEATQKNLEKATALVGDMHTRLEELKKSDKLYSKDALESSLAQAKADVELITKADPADTETIAAAQSVVDGVQSKLDRLDTPEFKEAASTQATKVNKLQEEIKAAEGVLVRFSERTVPADTDLEVEAKKITSADPVASKAIAENVINLSMAAPDKLSHKTALALADDQTNGLTEPQRNYFRELSARQVEANKAKDLEGVAKDIYFGGPGLIGAEQYRRNISAALNAGKENVVLKNLKYLGNFVSDHTEKGKLVAQAYSDWKKDRQARVVKKLEDGGWVIEMGHLKDADRETNGAVNIDFKTKNLAVAIPTAAAAIAKTYSWAVAAYELKFNPTEKTNGTQAPEAKQAKAQGQEAPKPVATPVTSVTPAEQFAGVLDTQNVYDNWSNVRDGTDRATMRDQMVTIGKALADNPTLDKAQTEKELKTQFKWFRSATPEQRSAALDLLLKSTPTETKSTAEEQTQSTDKTSTVVESTDSTTSVVESAEQTTLQESLEKTEDADEEADVDVEGPVDGTLEATKEKAPEGSSYEQLKFGDLVKQKLGSDTGSVRPLVAVKNFLSMLSDGKVAVQDYLKGEPELTSEQESLLRLMKKMLDHVSDKIKTNLKPRNTTAFNHEDPIRYLIGSDKDVEQNVKTAMVAAMFSFIADQSGRPRLNGNDSINTILHRATDHPVNSKEWEMLGHVGVYRHVLAASIGQKVIDSLGLSANKDVAGQDLMPKLQESLGAHTLKLMEDLGLIEATEYTNAEMAELTNSVTNTGFTEYTGIDEQGRTVTKLFDQSQNKGHVFYRVVADEKGNLTGLAHRLALAVKGTNSLIERLFGMEQPLKFAYLAPSKAVDKFTEDGLKVPKFLRKVLRQKNQEPWTLNNEVFNLFGLFEEHHKHAMIGVEEITSQNTHQEDVRSKEAKNEGLIRELSAFEEFTSEEIAPSELGGKTPFYLGFNVWVQQRVGVDNTAVNPVASKVVRWLIAAPAWDTMIKFSEEKQLQSFFLKASEGFGFKPEKKDSDKAIADLEAFVAKPRVAQGLLAVRKQLRGEELTEADRQHVVNAVEDGGQKLHSLASLVAYAKYQQAVANEEENFTTNLMGEVDGVSNGSILNHVLYGAAKTATALNRFLESGGIYASNSLFRQFNLWRATPGHYDTYEAAALATHELVSQEVEPTLAKALWVTGGSVLKRDGSVASEGRNLMKTGINPLNYGSGLANISNRVVANYMDNIREKLAKLSADGAFQDEVDGFIEQLNVVLEAGGAEPLRVGMPIVNYMGYKRPTFTDKQAKALMAVYSENIGERMTQVIATKFKPLMSKTRNGVQASNTMFNVYNSVYQAERKAVLDTLPKKKNGNPIRDLTATEEKAITDKLEFMLPIINSAMSAAESNIDAGLLMMDKEKSTSADPMYSVTTVFGRPTKAGRKEMTLPSQHTTNSAPGVAMVAKSTQSTDSFISHTTQLGRQVFNMHDALGDGIGSLRETAIDLNKNTFKALVGYSPLMSTHAGLMRVLHGVVALEEAKQLTSEARTALVSALGTKPVDFEGTTAEWFADSVDLLFTQALRAERTKLEAMLQWVVVDQYTFDGGSYEVTDEDHQNVQERLARLPKGMTQEQKDLLKSFTDTVFGAPVAAAPKAEPVTEISQFFTKKNGQSTAKEMYDFLKNTGKLSLVNRKLLELAYRTIAKINPNLKLRMVNSTTDEGILAPPTVPSSAWYVSKGGQSEAYFLAPGVDNSNLTAEAVLHEMIHAAVSQIIANPSLKHGAGVLVKELERLRKQAEKFINDNKLDQHRDAVSSVHELVSWGMTNQAFQDDVLNKISVKTSTSNNRFVKGMQKFIDTLVALLYKPNDQLSNGMDVLIKNASALFQAAAETETEETNDVNQSMAATVPTYRTEDIFMALDNGAVGAEFQAHLGNLLDGIVEKLHGPFGAIAEAFRKDAAANPMTVWFKAISDGKAPFVSSIIGSRFAGSAQEDFVMQQVEITVATAINENATTTKQVYRELVKLFDEAKATLSAQDFINAGFNAADYDFVFKIQSSTDRSDYLSRFAAIGLANERFSKLLDFTTQTQAKPSTGSLFNRLARVFERILNFFNMKASHTYEGQKAGDKLTSLVEQLVDMETKRQAQIALGKNGFNKYVTSFEGTVKDLTDKTKGVLYDAVTSDMVKNSSYSFVRTTGALASIVTAGRSQIFMEKLRSARDYVMDERDGVLSGLLRDVSGPSELFQRMLMLVKHHENLRQNMITQTGSMLMRNFVNNGKDITKDQKNAMTSVLLRTGAHNLMTKFSFQQISDLLKDDSALNTAIADQENLLSTGLKDHHIKKVMELGYWKATDINVSDWLMKNSYLIAGMKGTPLQNKITTAQAAQEEPIIKMLATLYSIKYSKQQQRNQAAEVLDKELARKDGNGIELMLGVHRDLEMDALERLFDNNPTQMIHGYTPEIYDPHVDMQVVDQETGDRLIARGYKHIHDVTIDNDLADEDGNYGGKKGLYVLQGGGLNRRVSGMFSLTSLQSKGTSIHNGWMNVNTVSGLQNAATQADVTNRKANKLKKFGTTKIDPSSVKGTKLAPIYDDRGNVVNWAHLMSGEVRDNVLRRENRFDKVMGTLAGSVFDKETTQGTNKLVAEKLHEQYEAGYDAEPYAYVTVSGDSEDQELKELWQLLPEETKKEIQRVWGGDFVVVRKDSLDITFGYRKLTVSSVLTKEREDLEGVQKFIRELFHSFAQSRGMNDEQADDFAKKVGTLVLQGERGWQELNQMFKDIIVIKNLATLVGNVWSNASLLWLMGVPNAWKHQWTALRGIMSYEADAKRLKEIEAKLETGYSPANLGELQQEATKLKDAIARNPVTKMVEAGLMPTIVEDVDLMDDPYSYKTALAEKTDKYVSKIPGPVKTAAKYVFMTHDTPLYTVLSRATQYSDFLARYALYQHVTTREENKLTHDQGILKALNAFVHYDVPMQRTLQYFDDMGTLAFMKYFLRVQKVLMETFKENPGRFLTMLLARRLVELGPVVLDSSALAHLGNMPLRAGPLQLPWALDELLTVKASMALIK